MNDVSGLWARGTALNHLVPVLGVIRAGDGGLEYESLTEGVTESVGSGLFALHFNSPLVVLLSLGLD